MGVQCSGCGITRILKKERLKINPSVTELFEVHREGKFINDSRITISTKCTRSSLLFMEIEN